MTEAEKLAAFVRRARFEEMSAGAREQLKLRILDSIGCAFGALAAKPIRAVRAQSDEFGGAPLCTLTGGGKSAPDRTAFYNGALVRYLDFMDSYLAPGETCHLSDNLAPVLAAAEYADASGTQLLTALAVAYQVHARLSDEAPVRERGFEGARLSHAAFIATHAAFLAMRGITAPPEVFEGRKGFQESVSGPYEIDWAREDLERVKRTIIKKYNAEIHAQSAVEGAPELRREHGFDGAAVARVEVDIFDIAHRIISGGEGDKTLVRTKEDADHCLPYMLAAALRDGELTLAQYAPERIRAPGVQHLIHCVTVRSDPTFSSRFPAEMACRVTVALHDGRRFEIEKRDYEGFHTRPMSPQRVAAKFHDNAGSSLAADIRDEIVDAVERLDDLTVRQLTTLLYRQASGEI